jgi:hypothetical protein
MDDRLRETLRHVNEVCADTQRVVFVTTEWKSRVWKRHTEALRRLKAEVQPILVDVG